MNLFFIWFTVSAIEGSVSGIPVLADSGKKKILLLKGKRPETPVSVYCFVFVLGGLGLCWGDVRA